MRARLSLRGVSDLVAPCARRARKTGPAPPADALGWVSSQRAALASSVIRALAEAAPRRAPRSRRRPLPSGREREGAELHRLRQAAAGERDRRRALGKTRLALQLAWQVLDRFADGVGEQNLAR